MLACVLVATPSIAGCSDDTDPTRRVTDSTASVTWRAEIIARKAHDTNVFTQGLEIDGTVLYESSGLYGRSSVRAIDRASGRVLRSYDLPATMFAEGLTRIGDRLVVLTWHDGSDRLTVRDPQTLVGRRTVVVSLAGAAVTNLNELECVSGAVYANVWRTDRIVRIDATSGQVTAIADTPELRPRSTIDDPDGALNGIAYDATNATFLLTGKRWPEMFEVRFVPTS